MKALIRILLTVMAMGTGAMPAQDNTPVTEWGFIGGRIGGWTLTPGEPGDVTISGAAPNATWSAVRGGFDAITPTADGAIVIRGKMEFIGGGFEGWSGLRFGVFYSDSAGTVIADSSLDSNLVWSGTEEQHYGYLFIPPSGTDSGVGWQVGNGTHGVVVGGRWLSTYGNGAYPLDVFPQAPRRAVAGAGVYELAISIQPLNDGNSEIRFWLIKDDESYYFGGISLDDHQPPATDKFNCVAFAVNSWEGSTTTGLKLYDITVGLGEPLPTIISEPGPPYVDQWGFIGGRFGGWRLTPGQFVGNVTISGDSPNASWVAVRGGFFDTITPSVGQALVVSGRIEFLGGGFEATNSFRFGIFNSDSAGLLLNSPADSTHWAGTENHHSGYLLIPPSGTNVRPNWGSTGQPGTSGAVVDGVWLSPGGENNYAFEADSLAPANAVASEGLYDFAISIAARGNGANQVRFYLAKDDHSYYFFISTIDNHVPPATNRFNCVAFALDSGNSTTAMKISDVLIDMQTHPVSVETPEILPTDFALSQNYPNPFNPSTTIEFALPKSSKLELRVYDILGRVVAELAAGTFNAGSHKITFDARHLASGIYFYKLQVGDFVEVRKAVLVK